MQSLRFADPQTVTRYPLEISRTADWRPVDDDLWAFSVDIGRLPKGEMLAPSLSLLGAPEHRFIFSLEADGATYELAPVPPAATDKDRRGKADGGKRVRTAIDCFHMEKRVRHARLHCQLQTPVPPRRYLLTLSIRPTEIDISAPATLARQMAKPTSAISQMLQNPRIAARACSPVATAMVIAAHRAETGTGIPVEQVIADCHDPVTGMYGLWPLAVRAAASANLIGAVELFSDWSPALQCLEAGLPLVASIRYGDGELADAPMRSTAGHLVVVTGVDGDSVLVNDPAAPYHGVVSRHYPLEAFSRAWFRHRGAVYILCP